MGDMGIYHMMAVFFPVVLLDTAFLLIVIRAISTRELGDRVEPAIAPLMYLGVFGGMVAYLLGLLSWHPSAVASSPLGRNHLLQATWTLTYWAMLSVMVHQIGPALWIGGKRWIMVILAAIGVCFLMLAGTLGNALATEPSNFTALVNWLGWDVYTTFYVPTRVIVLMVVTALVLVLVGAWSRLRGT